MPEQPLTREQVERLVDFTGHLNAEAEACADAKLWRAAALLVAQSVEAGLLANVVCSAPELHAVGAWPNRGDLPQRWPLTTLVDVARAAGWLPRRLPPMVDPTDTLDGDVGDAIDFLCEVRNLAAHPGRMASSLRLPGFDFADENVMRDVYRVTDGIAGAVFEKLNTAIEAIP